jgi:hypothetical protein
LRILLDESVPKALGAAIEGHFVRSVQFAGLQNGELMAAMLEASYDVLITFDQNLPYQQNVVLPVTVLVLIAQNNRVETALQFTSLIQNALTQCLPGQLIRLELN